MDNKTEQISEAKILEAARKVFQKSGYAGARMQEIADEAGINKAMLHYYYRSKDNLFEAIFTEALGKFFGSVGGILGSDKPFEEKIGFFINSYISLLQENQYLPLFIMQELANNPERLQKFFGEHIPAMSSFFIDQIQKEVDNRNIAPIDPRQFLINLLSLCIFPFAARPIIKTIFKLNDKEYDKFIEDRKELLPSLIIKSVKP